MGRDGRGVKAASESSIEISFQYQGQRCRERVPLKPTTANLRRAEQHRAAILDAIIRGVFDYAATFPGSANAKRFAKIPGQVKTVEEYLEAWLARKKKHLKLSTWDGYRKVVSNLLIPKFGSTMLADWKRKDFREWFDEMTVTNKRFANILSVARAALSDAVQDELIEVNPLYGWSYERPDAPKPEDDVDPLTPEEQAAILAKCEPMMRNQLQFMLWTGLRPSEMIALDWGDFDAIRGVVVVRKAMTQAGKGEVEDTKTKSGRREVKLLSPAREALKAQEAHTRMAGQAIFVHPRLLKRWTGDQQLRDEWIRILGLAQVRYRRPYQTRHTYASMLLSAGESPMWVAKQMGHRDWTMIARIYGKWMPAADPSAGGRAEEKFAGKLAPKEGERRTG
ncbi:site-specific tyrosine recombinase XerC [Achromobacter xylosoxidans]|uniref:site-specific integrase n=1 Tax=Alcaligenes xylosoxydans xylosoxydans TaxID=85698 RepID=UPI0006C3379F|nr:site-specific integrase [Achromobacter xylosoxidans]CUK13206.1 site-specific tyrosine recombinase XerC [Achromobacter xylosoxidans]